MMSCVPLDQLCIYFSIYISVLRTLSPSHKSGVDVWMGSKDEATRASTFTSEDKFPAK